MVNLQHLMFVVLGFDDIQGHQPPYCVGVEGVDEKYNIHVSGIHVLRKDITHTIVKNRGIIHFVFLQRGRKPRGV